MDGTPRPQRAKLTNHERATVAAHARWDRRHTVRLGDVDPDTRRLILLLLEHAKPKADTEAA